MSTSTRDTSRNGCAPASQLKKPTEGEHRRCDYDSGKDAPLVQGSPHEDGSLLRGEHRERIAKCKKAVNTRCEPRTAS
jgi:hypothetical protein